jgi:hypothetical protein
MSQQGPGGGGYGSGPGGGPPGGYGPPGRPGGYGPPGGYGHPGAPHGHPAQHGYPPNAPAHGYPQPAAAKKKSNALLFVGLGCLVLLLGGIAVGVIFFLQWKSKYDEITAGVGAIGSATPGAAGGAVCSKAANCCRAIMQKTPGAGADASKTCDAFMNSGVPEASCQQALDGYRKTSGFLGVSCD